MKATLTPTVRDEIDGVFGLELTGKEPGYYTIDARCDVGQGLLTNSPDTHGLKPDATLSASSEDFVKALSGELLAPLAVMTGRIKIKGDTNQARKLAMLLMNRSSS